MAYALHGNVYESHHEVTDMVNMLIGDTASQSALVRLKRLMELHLTIDAVRRMANKLSADQYLTVLDKIEQKIKETM